MTLLTIVLLISVGILLLFLEFFVVPGITIAGLGGSALIIAGIVVAFMNYPAFYGFLTMAITMILLILFFIYVFYGKGMKKISLETNIDSKVNQIDEELVKIGDIGLTVSRLAPMGKIIINNNYYEAEAQNDFIDHETQIEVIKILKNKIIVKKFNN